MGSSPHYRAYVLYCELGDRVQEVRAGTQGTMLLRVGEASKGASVWMDKGMRTVDSFHRFILGKLRTHVSIDSRSRRTGTTSLLLRISLSFRIPLPSNERSGTT